MKRSSVIAVVLRILVGGGLLVVSSWLEPAESKAGVADSKELLVYCGITMIKPVAEIARVIEAQTGYRIIVLKDGSGNLLRAIRVNQVGDLFLPGSDSYIKTCLEEGLVTETVDVGHNKAAIMVAEGNPKGITSDLGQLRDQDLAVVVGNPDSGSIGRETGKILKRRGIYDEVLSNARELTTDSKDLVRVLKQGEADVVINWYATATWPENRDFIDAISIDEKYAKRKKLVLGLLTCSGHPKVARQFMAYASSPEGQQLFEKYGLRNMD